MFKQLDGLRKRMDNATMKSDRDPNATEKIKAILSKAKQ
jgi:hypothetical protein